MKMSSVVVCTIKLVGTIFVVLQFDLLFSNYSGVVAVAAKHVACIQKERHALLELKASFVLDDSNLLQSWDSKSDGCCAWEGIGCSNQTGHVEMLDLNGDQVIPFRGKINRSVIDLQNLKYLNLSFNRMSNDNFPELFGSLRNLRFLDLQSSFRGGRIPNDLARLLHLQYLDLSWNGLKGTIPHQFGNLSHLQHLDLSSNYGVAGTIPHQLGNLSHLHYLDLSSNFLVGTIPHQLGSLSNLQELHLEYNEGLKVQDQNNHAGGEWLSNLTLLTHLDLSGVPNLKSSHMWMQMIGKLPKIQELKLSGCDLSDLYLRSISRSPLNFSTSLAILDLSSNTFSSSNIFEWVFNATTNLIELDLCDNFFEVTISYDFGNTRNHLEKLDLSGTDLQGGTSLESFSDICSLQSMHLDYSNLNEDISTILRKLSGCARYSLQDLSLHDNQITGTFPDLSIFPSLKTIDLSTNKLNGKVPHGIPKSSESLIPESNSIEGGIPESFGNLCPLRSLDLSSNKLNEDLSVILHNISFGCAKYSLQQLNFARNKITGMVPDMSGFSSLESLLLSDNLLNGNILKNYTFPYQLERLYLDSNKLEGVITDSHFGNMSKLMDVDLSHNSLVLKFSEDWVPSFQLYGMFLRSCILGPRFPKWLQSQKHLQVLDISDAGSSDVVPVWFWTQTTNLTSMNVSYNNLTGTIPNLPIRLNECCQVILDSNQFEGSIPSFFRRAEFLQMSKNKLSETHLFLCSNSTIDKLRILDLSMNQLSRKLHDCWSHLKALEFLDLSDNTLCGEVPSSMGSLLEFKVLILRNNSFYGKLPVSLKNCKNPIMLDLGDNRFTGPIPYWLGQQMQMLSLRRNQFYGSLPQSLCYLQNIELLDLSENNLSGRIFKCLKNFSAMSQNVSSTSTIDSVLFYRFRFIDNHEGLDLIVLFDEERNQLIGDIPEEIGNLIELVSLNLSSNKLTGEISSKIGRLTSLDSLDLSRNHLSGPIPPSLAQIDRVSMLNLADNNLSGRIPIGTQLQSFDASSYQGNVDLCGKPLEKICPGDEEVAHHKPETHEESSQEDKKPIYLSVTLGFITGFWGLWGSLFLSRTWRHTYVLFLNYIVDTVYVFIVLNATEFQMWLRGLLETFSFPSFTLSFIYCCQTCNHLNHEIQIYSSIC
ncbi:putative non-specific serine/threonine protein kinase [Medicago truncatula]|uniref:Putative non-specific serine/threonine protein kinase n=1 Tax=Medicago truncatula TaxID=3880 RepID=A0A396HZI7_MEDTR|nr:putative non-specific serine/threonine protein kinase [Medicago truncatula]